MRWLRKLFNGDTTVPDMEELDQRVADAEQQRVEAAAIRAEAEMYGPRNRRHVERNGFGEGFKVAFEAARRERPA